MQVNEQRVQELEAQLAHPDAASQADFAALRTSVSESAFVALSLQQQMIAAEEAHSRSVQVPVIPVLAFLHDSALCGLWRTTLYWLEQDSNVVLVISWSLMTSADMICNLLSLSTPQGGSDNTLQLLLYCAFWKHFFWQYLL